MKQKKEKREVKENTKENGGRGGEEQGEGEEEEEEEEKRISHTMRLPGDRSLKSRDIRTDADGVTLKEMVGRIPKGVTELRTYRRTHPLINILG